MSSKILFPTSNVSLGQAINIVKTGLADESISLKTRVLAIDHVAHMETHNSITKDELVEALRWLFDHYDFEESNGIKSRGRFMEITEENAIEELCEQQKGNTNQSPAPEDF